MERLTTFIVAGLMGAVAIAGLAFSVYSGVKMRDRLEAQGRRVLPISSAGPPRQLGVCSLACAHCWARGARCDNAPRAVLIALLVVYLSLCAILFGWSMVFKHHEMTGGEP